MAIENANIKKAKDEVEIISAEEEERRIARFYENGALEARFQYTGGFDDGKAEGKSEGLIEGAIKKGTEIAKQMLKRKYNISEIISLTGLSEKEILKLSKSI